MAALSLPAMSQLSAGERLRLVCQHNRCPLCQEDAPLSTCAAWLENTLATLLGTQIQKGAVKVCVECKTFLNSRGRMLLENLSVFQNDTTSNKRAIYFLANFKTLKRTWLCRTCGKTTRYINRHHKTCLPHNEPTTTSSYFTQPAVHQLTATDDEPIATENQSSNQSTASASTSATPSGKSKKNVTVLGKRRRDSIGNKRVTFNVNRETADENNEITRQNKNENNEITPQTVEEPLCVTANVEDENLQVKEEPFAPTQVAKISSQECITISDDEEETHTVKNGIAYKNSPKKQTLIDNFVVRSERPSRDDNISSTSAEYPGAVVNPEPEAVEHSRHEAAVSPQLEAILHPGPALVAKLHQCDKCNESFSTSKGLKNHEATKGSKCLSCEEVFCTRKQLTVHRRSHCSRASRASVSDNVPAVCVCCDREFRSEKDCRKHRESFGQCHGGPQQLINFDCACQRKKLPARRQSVFRDPRVQVELPSTSVQQHEPPVRRMSEVSIKREPLDEDDLDTQDISQFISEKRARINTDHCDNVAAGQPTVGSSTNAHTEESTVSEQHPADRSGSNPPAMPRAKPIMKRSLMTMLVEECRRLSTMDRCSISGNADEISSNAREKLTQTEKVLLTLTEVVKELKSELHSTTH